MARTRQKPAAETVLPVPPPLPGWARGDGSVTDTDADPGAVSGAAFQAGAALAMLDLRMRADVRFAGAWRRRLALKAAVASVRITRRGEDEGLLRDAFLLRHGGDDPGPAGRLLVAWRGLDRQAARVVVAQRPDAEILSLWLADAVLAVRLKWPLPLPLIAGALLHPSLRTGGHRPYPGDATWTLTCCLAYGRAPRSRPVISLPSSGAARNSSSRSLPGCGRRGPAPSSKPCSTKTPCCRRPAAAP